MNYSDLKELFRKLKRSSPKEDLTAHIIFTGDRFFRNYLLFSRTCTFTSDNKAFRPNMGVYSIFVCCPDGSDRGVHLDWYMAEEWNANGWKVENCYILEQMRDTKAIPNYSRAMQSDGTVCDFFGNTCIRIRESCENGKICLEPVSGDQAACGEWVELSIDRVYGHCSLLERHLNRRDESQK